MDLSSKYLRVALSVLITLACIYLIAQLRLFFRDIWLVFKALFIPFLVSMVVTYILQPLVQKLVSRKVPHGVAILVIYLVFALLSAILLVQAIPMATRQFVQLGQHLPQLVTRLDHWMDALDARKRYLPDAVRLGLESALSQLEQGVARFTAHLVPILSSTLGTIFVLFTVPFLVFYMLKDARVIGRAMIRLFPTQYRDEAREILAGIDDTLGGYIRGQFMVMAAVGVLGFAGYLVIGLPYALLMAICLALMDIIPYLGPFLGAAPALFLALSVGPGMALKVLIVNVIVQQLEGNLISPQIMGRTLHLHPMAIVAAVIIGGELGGFLGLVCAVPVLAVLKVVYANIREFRMSGRI